MPIFHNASCTELFAAVVPILLDKLHEKKRGALSGNCAVSWLGMLHEMTWLGMQHARCGDAFLLNHNEGVDGGVEWRGGWGWSFIGQKLVVRGWS